ncbi:DNA methyltransferase [Metapseudomonas otitidis]|uniref:DNA methyltransferase n=1 Tax=Metapseudomonas otitidis TaxID=319939 RepID=UPI00244C3885|nr:DNA methyltransferase [Pseudomonas otitidis]MDG9784681.1 DNA methyltransferase [Pseudomonas otitidis]
MKEPFILHLGDCLEVMRTLPDNSVDSVVTDPPYGLSFMGKHWDYDVPSVEIWAECLRVLKPGGHLLAFAGTRTQHRMAVRIEDAGFEIRDMIAWVYGSGFPKSMDVSKAIDKAGGISPAAQASWLRGKREAAGLSREQVAEAVGCTLSSIRDWEEGRARTAGAPVEFMLPSEDYRARLIDLFDYTAAAEREVVAKAGGSRLAVAPGQENDRAARVLDITASATEAARQWEGWGTALKPALEPITVARKPLAGTVAANVLAHGTGALNIDGCRIPSEPMPPNTGAGGLPRRKADEIRGPGVVAQPHDGGRWPANLIHDGSPEVVALFPSQADAAAPVRGTEASAASAGTITGVRDRVAGAFHADTGSAARFFYCPKASRRDRNEGTDALPQIRGGMVSNTSGQHMTRRDGYSPPAVGNHHPTVKPTALMAYLCRLVTPPGGVVLDPFMGSGSTGKAAMREGFQFIGCEMSPEYMAIAQARIAYELKHEHQDEPEPEQSPAGPAQLDIFNDTKEPAA